MVLLTRHGAKQKVSNPKGAYAPTQWSKRRSLSFGATAPVAWFDPASSASDSDSLSKFIEI